MVDLKSLRTTNNLTLSELSKELKITSAYLSYLETGKRKPSVVVAKKLAKYYKMDWTKFFE